MVEKKFARKQAEAGWYIASQAWSTLAEQQLNPQRNLHELNMINGKQWDNELFNTKLVNSFSLSIDTPNTVASSVYK